jgi:hypothetical protein
MSVQERPPKRRKTRKKSRRPDSWGVPGEWFISNPVKTFLVSIALMVACLCAWPEAAFATARSWNVAAGNWNTAANWNPSGVPGSADDVTITGGSGTITIDTNVDVNSILVDGANTRTIEPAGAETIRVRGDLTLASTAAAGTFRLSSDTTRIGGQLNRSTNNMTLAANGGTVLFEAASGAKSHTLNGASLNNALFNDGLIAYWRLDENSGTNAADASGYGHAATLLNGATWSTSGPTSVSFSNTSVGSFNGSTASASVADATDLQITGDLTIAFWMNRAAASADYTRMVGKGNNIQRNYGVWTGPLIGYRVLFQQYNASGTSVLDLQSTTAPAVGTWYHIACTISGTTAKIYVNGNLEGTATRSGTPGTSTAALTFAYAGFHTYFNGSIDDVRIYNRALTAAEVGGLGLGFLPATSAAVHTLADGLTVTNNFTVASGSVGNGANPVTVGGSWLNYGGTFAAGSGVVTLNGSGAATLRSGQFHFANLRVSGTGSWTLADRLWIDGTLTMSSGTIDQSSRNHAIVVQTVDKTGGTLTGSGNLVVRSNTAQTLAMNSNGISNVRFESPIEPGLVGNWKLDGDQGLGVRDSSSNGFHGMLENGARWWGLVPPTSFDNPAVMFADGVDDRASIPDNAALRITGDITIAFWVARIANSTDWTRLVGKGSFTQRNYGAWIGPANGYRVLWQQTDSAGGLVLNVTSTTALGGGWYHIACTISGNTAQIYINGAADGAPQTRIGTPATSTDPLTFGYSGTYAAFPGALDDVRIYNRALSATEVAALAAGRYASGTGGATITLGGNLTANGTLAVDNGALATSTFAVDAAATDATKLASVNAGTLTVGTGALAFRGGLTVQRQGTLTLASGAGSVAIGAGKTLTMDGTLNASAASATIKSVSGNYAFAVGSTATARPTLNITGLAVKNTDTNGMWINANTGSVTTFTRFDGIAFSSGTGSQLLQIYAPSLHLTSSGCTFDSGVAATTSYSVRLTGNGTGDGETRAIFGGSTCANNFTNCQASKSDDDGDNNGIGDTPGSNGAVVQFIRVAGTDTAGTIEGFPTAAFDWNTFTYYATYVAYHDVSGTADRIYVRDETGAARYSWDTGTGETIVGTPRWITTGTTHYVFVALASGKIYRLVDNGSTLAPDSSGNWAGANNPFDCGCTIVSPLALSANNVHWGGTTSGATQRIWTLGQVSRSQPTGSPFTITPVITSASPSLWTSGATSYLFMGVTGNLVKLNVSDQTLEAANTNPGSAAVRGRVVATTSRVFAGDDGGTMWALDPTSFGGTNKLWSYSVAGDSIQSSAYYDYGTATLHFGTDGGKVVALNASGAVLTGYPYVPGATTDTIRTAILYLDGVLVVGTTTGKLFFLDRDNGTTGPALIKQYYFGPTQTVSGIGYDPNAARYMVSTADPSTKDGRLYFLESVTDPTSAK